jgi:hypothetical protein
MGLFELLALFVVALQLRTLLPLPVPFRWCSGWAILTIPCSCLCSRESGRWRWRTTCNTATSGGISMMLGLVGALVSIAWRASTVLDDRSHLWWWTTRTSTIRWERTRGRLTRWTGQTSRWWGRRRWNTAGASMWTVIRVRNTVRLLGLLRLLGLVGRRRWLLSLGRLRCKLWWLRVVGTGSHVVRLWRG